MIITITLEDILEVIIMNQFYKKTKERVNQEEINFFRIVCSSRNLFY